jgi:sugar/nucleoside kinase (ribokinase family)
MVPAIANASLAEAGSIAGTISHVGGGLPGARVTVYAVRPGGSLSTVTGAGTDPLGAYAFRGLAPGDYKLCFSDPSGAHVTEYYDNQATAAAGTTVTVTTAGPAIANASLAEKP